jgi:acyl-coenzyme A synthetase/AMP-(fatty) acid ligase
MKNAVHGGPRPTDTAALAEEVGRAVASAAIPDGPIAFIAQGAQALGAAAWLRQSGIEGLIVGPERWTDVVRAAAAERGFSALDLATGQSWPAPTPGTVAHGRVWLLTSGTTGAPKWVAHTWDSLVTVGTGATHDLPPRHWLLAYQPGTYAWYQVAQLPLFFPHQSVTVPTEPDPASQVRAAATTGVDAVSSTPTFWRVALLTAGEPAVAGLRLRQVTLGGERVDQPILDTLRRLFPKARVTHIYAATEVGAAIVVHDGREGFPAAWLERDAKPGEPPRPLLRVQDGRLWVRSPKAGEGLQGWTDTGDSVEVRGDRVVVIGRAGGGLAKVGGATVDLRQVEAAILQDPEVLWCRVRARNAPVVGALLAAEVVGKPGVALDADALRSRVAARIADYMVPRFWQVRTEIPATGNFKTELA